MSFSPVLCEQLASPLFQSEHARFLRTVCALALKLAAYFRQKNQDESQCSPIIGAVLSGRPIHSLQDMRDVLAPFRD